MRGQLYDRESRSATRLTGQNVRGLTPLKLEKAIQFMMDHRILITCLMETWHSTPHGCEVQEVGQHLVVHHGEKEKTCRRGRNGVAIILSPEARAAWEARGSKISYNGNGRLLTMLLAVEGGLTLPADPSSATSSSSTSQRSSPSGPPSRRTEEPGTSSSRNPHSLSASRS